MKKSVVNNLSSAKYLHSNKQIKYNFARQHLRNFHPTIRLIPSHIHTTPPRYEYIQKSKDPTSLQPKDIRMQDSPSPQAPFHHRNNFSSKNAHTIRPFCAEGHRRDDPITQETPLELWAIGDEELEKFSRTLVFLVSTLFRESFGRGEGRGASFVDGVL